MAITINMQSPNGLVGEQFTPGTPSSSGNTYIAGANGLITGVLPQDAVEMQKFGCNILPQAGAGTALMLEAGNLFTGVYGATANEPSATNADYVLASYTIPAKTFDGLGNSNRAIVIEAIGGWAATANVKRCKLWFNATAATVGSTVSGGTLIADTSSATGSGMGWQLKAEVGHFGAPNSNTQVAATLEQTTTAAGAAVRLAGPPALSFPTATENASILVCVTGNAPTAVSDINLNLFTITMYD
jgi:hypothetical protein